MRDRDSRSRVGGGTRELAMALVLALPGPTVAEELWGQFRGPAANPTSEHLDLPLSWSTTDNVEWVVDVPGLGWSSPIVVGGLVLVTTTTSDAAMKPPQIGTEYSNEYVAELLEGGATEEEAIAAVTERDIELPHEIEIDYTLMAFDLESGELRWESPFHSGPPPGGRHRKNSFVSETPVTDGTHVYVYVTNLGLFAFDLEGDYVWDTELDDYPIYLDFGGGSSPVLADGKLFIQHDNQERQFVAAYSTTDGREIWRRSRELKQRGAADRLTSWTTPFVWRNERRSELITPGPGVTVAYDLDGQELWRMGGQSHAPIPSPFAYDGLLYVSSGIHGDHRRPITAIRPGGKGNLTLKPGEESSKFVAWEDATAGTYIPTPVAYNGALWVLYDRGIVARLDAKTGERVFKARLPRGAGAFTASPWAYGGHVFAISEEGDTFVLAENDELDVVGVNSLDEMVLSTPAIVGDRLLIRTRSKLYSIRDAGSER